MKKNTSQKLSNRLVKYGALSLAIAGVADVNGQVEYFDVNPDEGGDGILAFIDLNQDGIDDFAIRHFNSLSYYGYYNLNALVGFTTYGASMLGRFLYSSSAYPFALDQDTVISSAVASFNGYPAVWNGVYTGVQYMNISSCYYSGDSWCGVTDKYLGLRFLFGGNTHYGWARLDVNLDAGSGWLLKDYAWEQTPNTSIMAGEGRLLGIVDNVFSKIKIVALNKSIALFNLPEKTSYKLYSMAGQAVLDGKLENDTYIIVAETLSSGVYIIELEDNNSNAVIRKKIVL